MLFYLRFRNFTFGKIKNQKMLKELIKIAKKQRYKNNKKYKISKEQKTIIKRLAQFNVLTDYLLEKSTGLKESSKYIKALIENKIIEKTEKFNYKTNEIEAYKLTKKGKNLAKEEGLTVYYSNSKRHDIAHATNIINCFTDKLDFYKSEKELKKISGLSKCDGAITMPSGTILVETITQNYSKEKIESKRAYAESYSAEQYVEYLEFKN